MAQTSYNITQAAAEFGLSRDVISNAIKTGDLVAHYPTSRPLLFHEEIEAWIKSTPTEPKS